jgi:hypothetical protein
MGLFWNVLGVCIVFGFVALVDWSPWVSVPVGVLIAALTVVLVSYLKAKVLGRVRYGDW